MMRGLRERVRRIWRITLAWAVWVEKETSRVPSKRVATIVQLRGRKITGSFLLAWVSQIRLLSKAVEPLVAYYTL